jgi:plastocyanin
MKQQQSLSKAEFKKSSAVNKVSDGRIQSLLFRRLFLLIILSIFSFVLISGCIETKPREGFSTTVPVRVTTGSDVCAGYNESTCGAFLKEKREVTSDFICKGPVGPEDRKIEDFTYKMSPEEGWECKENSQTLIFDLPYKQTEDKLYCYSNTQNCKAEKSLSIYYKLYSPGFVSIGFLCERWSSTGRLDDEANFFQISYMCGSNYNILFSVNYWDYTKKCKAGSGDLTCDRLGCRVPTTFGCSANANMFIPSGDVVFPNVTLTTTLNPYSPCHDDCDKCPPPTSADFQIYLKCKAQAVYQTNWTCTRSATGESYKFVNCSYKSFKTFQGGKTYLDNDTPFSELSTYLHSYYGKYELVDPNTATVKPAGKIQVPFFMLGQGPTFQDYEEAKKLCVPWKETIVNISLGNTTFDPPFMSMPAGMQLCFDNKDKVAHKVDVVDLSSQEVVRSFNLQPGSNAATGGCFKPLQGFYHIKDSNGDYAYLSVLQSSDTANIYVGSRIVPNYTVVTEGGPINFTLLERKDHNLTMKKILVPGLLSQTEYEKNITLNTSNKVVTLQTSLPDQNQLDRPGAGEYKVHDNSTNQDAFIFVQSQSRTFLFKSDGTTSPNTTLYRPLGDTICFQSQTPLNITISKYVTGEGEGGGEWADLFSESLPIAPAYCCVKMLLPGYYMGMTNDSRVVTWVVGSGYPSATIAVQPIGFEPAELDSPPGTKVCWINPAAVTRKIETTSTKSNRVVASGEIPPLSDDFCYQVFNATGSYLTYFTSPALPKDKVRSVLNIKEYETKNIKVTAGGFDPFSTIVQPNQQVCWTNTDTKNHTMKTETGSYLTLAPGQTDCLDSRYVQDGALFTRYDDSTDSLSQVAVLDGRGFMITNNGFVPSYISIPPSIYNLTSTGERILVTPIQFKIMNKQNSPVEVYQLDAATLQNDTTGYANMVGTGDNKFLIVNNITAFTKLELTVTNNDKVNHTIQVQGAGQQAGDQVIIPAGKMYLFEFTTSGVLKDLTIADNLRAAGENNQTIIDAFSSITVNLVGPGEIKLAKAGQDGDVVTLQAPMDPLTVILYENNTNSTIALSFINTSMEISKNPLMNQTLDLPVQVVHGDLSSDTLYAMRAYADQGSMAMLIPSFKNVTVTISSAVFSPQNAEIPAGSKITITNRDVVDHTIVINQTTNGRTTSSFAPIPPLVSYQINDTPKNTIFDFADSLSNMKGQVKTKAYDAYLGITSTPIYPESGMVAVGGPVKFNNYDKNSDYKVEIVLHTTSGQTKEFNLNLPRYQYGPGQAVWIPQEAGDASYSVKDKVTNAVIGTGNVTVRNSIINVSIINGKFEKKSIAIDHESKVCFVPNSVRNITIKNLDTGEIYARAMLLPVGVNANGEGVCTKVFNCTAKPQYSGLLSCSGQVNQTLTGSEGQCYYSYTNASQVCMVNRTYACVSKNPDMICSSDYSKDTNPSLPGVQPQCLFTANPAGDACKGNLCQPKVGVSGINCGPVDINGNCRYNSTSDRMCSSLFPFTSSNNYCTVNSAPTGTLVPGKETISILYIGTAPNCPAGYTKKSVYTTMDLICTKWHYLGREKICDEYKGKILYCEKNVNLPCEKDWYCEYNNIPSIPGFPACKVTISGKFYTYSSIPCIDRAIQRCSQFCPIYSCSDKLQIPGLTTCQLVQSSCVNGYMSGAACYTPYQASCKETDSSCGCVRCSKKQEYASLGNFNCGILNNRCVVMQQTYNQDSGTFCQYNITTTCIPTIPRAGFDGSTFCGYNASTDSCYIPQPNKQNLDQNSKYCGLTLADCASSLEGVQCSFDSATQSCKANASEQFCFTPSSTYQVIDEGSGDTMTIEGYDRYTPLEISVQKSSFTPSYVTTSPLSDVCISSLDGKNHTIIVPDQVSTEPVKVTPSGVCLKFSYNPEPWLVRLEGTDATAGVQSIKQDIEIVVKSQMFNPSDVILRPGTTLTFINKDNVSHTLNKTTTSLNLAGMYFKSPPASGPTFDSIFNSKGFASWLDKSECRNDSDCPSGSFCDVEKRCHPIRYCLTDDECPAGSICNNYMCIVPKSCSSPSDCGVNQTCSGGKCIALTSECQTDFDCGLNSGAICHDGKCTSLKVCSSNSDCGSGFCYNSSEYSTPFCTAPQTCNNNNDCPEDSACIDNICAVPSLAICEQNSDCPSGLTCQEIGGAGSGIKGCVGKKCSTNVNCTAEYGIDSNISCTDIGSEQETNYSCVLYNSTKPPLDAEGNCASGSLFNGKCALAKNCSVDSDCPSGLICSNEVCKQLTTCTSSAQCQPGEECSNGYCRIKTEKTCVNNSDCLQGEVCSGFKCIAKSSCSSTSNCISLPFSSSSNFVCTNESSTSSPFCKVSYNCTTNAQCPGSFQTCISGQCQSYPVTTCGSPLYGTDNSQFNVTFKLPASTFKVYLKYSFNDNGRVVLNGQEILPTTRYICDYGNSKIDKWTSEQTIKLPLSLIRKGSDENKMSVTICSCSGDKGFNITIYYQYVDPHGITSEAIVIDPNSQKTITVPSSPLPQEFAYIDSQTLNSLPVAIKPCSGSDLSSIALGIGSYERLDYMSPDCDAGKREECKFYNPYGPATVAFVSSETGLNLSDSAELNCALGQLETVKQNCPNCTTVLNVGKVNITQLNSILSAANSSGKLDKVDAIGYDEFLNEYPTCSFEDVMNSIVNKSKLGLYNYTKPSIIMRFGLKEGESLTNPACNWTGESITTAYQDFYGLWIPILAGSGVLGTAQYCLTDPCPSLDFYGLLTSGKTNKPFTDAWFREGCGRYYYNAEGLSFTTFSMKETNYSLCDPSRMLALLQTAQCAVGKYTLKSGTS